MPDLISGNNPEGIIGIELTTSDQRLSVNINSERPLLASRIFEGKSVSKSLQLIPMLFSVCGQAQSVAAVRAVESAINQPADTLVEQRREILIVLEGVREHLWRILMDWPKTLGQNPEAAVFAPLHQSLNKLIEIANPGKVFTTNPGYAKSVANPVKEFKSLWSDIKRISLSFLFSNPDFPPNSSFLPKNSEIGQLLNRMIETGMAQIGNIALPALPDLPHDALEKHLLDDSSSTTFIAQPDWDGQCYETGPFARQKLHPLVQDATQQFGSGAYPRMVARIIEFLQFVARIDAWLAGASLFHCKQANVQQGLSQVEAVRGRLVHSISVEHDRIQRFRILAPTEWNFHNKGIVSQMLSSLKADNTELLLKQSALLVKLIDPCVGFKLEFKHEKKGDLSHA